MILRLALFLLVLSSCETVPLFEKTESIPDHRWDAAFKPSFSFTISDTVSPHQLFIILRHTNTYSFNNIWINLTTRLPDGRTEKIQYELPLASREKGWLGAAMDDIYEHRIALTPKEQAVYFRQGGEYRFTVEQIMRENPLNEVLDVGLRIEKR